MVLIINIKLIKEGMEYLEHFKLIYFFFIISNNKFYMCNKLQRLYALNA